MVQYRRLERIVIIKFGLSKLALCDRMKCEVKMNAETENPVYMVTLSWNIAGFPLGKSLYQSSVNIKPPCGTPQSAIYARAVEILFQRFAELGCLCDVIVRPVSIVTV